MGPKHGIVGNPLEFDIPVMPISENELVDEKKAARFSKTAEFKKLKEHFEQRISFYQTWLPNGKAVQETELSDAELGSRWRTANLVINELNMVISAYEQAREVVEDAARRTGS